MTYAFAPGRSYSALALVVALGSAFAGCSNDQADSGKTPRLVEGQSEFSSAPPNGSQQRGPGGLAASDGNGAATGGSSSGAPPAGGTKTERKVEETDLYRLDGDRLYYLNQYRGLMVFDVTDVDHPKLLGRSPIYGSPVQMVVREGIASVVVADWFGAMDDGTPFHGSIVRGIDARDPANMKITGEAQLGGWVRDTRVVGDVLYAVTEKYPWDYGWYEGYGNAVAVSGGPTTAQVSVTSVNFAGGDVTTIDAYDVPGYGGVFNVTPDSILLASDVLQAADQNGYAPSTGTTQLRYLDISDPGGSIVERGTVVVPGSVQSWGADGGRWNLDFADGKTAHVVGRSYDYNGINNNNGIDISIADFTDPDAPTLTGHLQTSMPGWEATARFDGTRLYLSPTNWGCSSIGVTATGSVQTPLEVYDLSDGANPRRLGAATIEGQISLMIPNGDRLFALGNHYDCASYSASPIALAYFDMTDPTKPRSLGSAEFGKGWAWTPAAGTFKAFTKNDAEGLVVLPFSGWDYSGYSYNNGLQLIEFTPESIAASGTAKTSGWVERGIFVKNRLVSLSNLALTVVDYTDHENPTVVTELTLARNVVNAKPIAGDKLVELSSDFWQNDADHSELRVLPLAQAEENVTDATLASLPINGISPSVFHDGEMSYVVSSVRKQVDCPPPQPGQYVPEDPDAPGYQCYTWTNEVQVVDTSNGGAKLRGKIALPEQGTNYYYNWGWGWGGCGMYDWYYGSDVVQVDGNKLVFRRWQPIYDTNGAYVDARQSLFVVDASKPDALSVASTVVTREKDGWWGNLRAIGNTLYASHYEWHVDSSYDSVTGVWSPGVVRYYIDQIDLSDTSKPRVARKINVPGFLVGGSEDDPSLIYTMNYRWDGQRTTNELAVLKLSGDLAYLQGHVEIPGYTGNVFVSGSTAYLSAQDWESSGRSEVRLYQIDLSDPKAPAVRSTEQAKGWGWLLAVEGDRAFVTSGWSGQGVDIFKLAPGKAPAFEQFVRTRGWWTSSLARQDDTVLLASGYWGTQVVTLK
ncbi:MAG TPA: beta-propeller domain-containing protein [Polyangiaceae bacterium]|nr:beta-propeller domain-containing protein [Polyangiaceae bacterium]